MYFLSVPRNFVRYFFMSRIVLVVFIFALLLGLVSCDEPTRTTIVVDPTFREFYELLGDQEILGPPISVMYEQNGRYFQFTTTVLMVFDPYAPESSRLHLASLGNELRVAEQALQPDSPDGPEIYTGFLPLFRELGGTRYTGRPLTGIQPDPENKRIVQYFENVGFYQLETDPPDVAHLLDYGVWKCAKACGYKSPSESAVEQASAKVGEISLAIARLDPVLTGFPLSDAYVNNDGQEEQIFENVVIFSDHNSPGGIALQPLPKLLGIPADTPITAGQEEGKFIAVDGSHGFNVPYHFDDFISRNSGYDFIGKPISNYKRINDGLYRQCFENLCLDYRPDEIENLQIRPMSLGRRYNQQHVDTGGTNSFEAVTLTVWERYPVIASSEVQEIQVLVLDNGNPLKNIDLVMTVTMPNGSQRTYNFPPTGRDGQARSEVEPISAPNGTLIVYEVCVDNTDEAPDCVVDDYLIWGNP